MKKLLTAAVAAIALASAAAPAYADGWQTGTWHYDDNKGGWDIVNLYDENTGEHIGLIGTEVSCGGKGAPYAAVHDVLYNSNDDDGRISWKLIKVCDGRFARYKFQNGFGQWATTTYEYRN